MQAKLPVSLSGVGPALDPGLAIVFATEGKPSPIVLNYGDTVCQQIAVTNIPSNPVPKGRHAVRSYKVARRAAFAESASNVCTGDAQTASFRR